MGFVKSQYCLANYLMSHPTTEKNKQDFIKLLRLHRRAEYQDLKKYEISRTTDA